MTAQLPNFDLRELHSYKVVLSTYILTNDLDIYFKQIINVNQKESCFGAGYACVERHGPPGMIVNNYLQGTAN